MPSAHPTSPRLSDPRRARRACSLTGPGRTAGLVGVTVRVSGRPAAPVDELGEGSALLRRRRPRRLLVVAPVAEGDGAHRVEVGGDAERRTRGPVVLRGDAEEAGAQALVDR